MDFLTHSLIASAETNPTTYNLTLYELTFLAGSILKFSSVYSSSRHSIFTILTRFHLIFLKEISSVKIWTDEDLCKIAELIYSQYKGCNERLTTRYNSVTSRILVGAVSHTSQGGCCAIWKLFARDFRHKLRELIRFNLYRTWQGWLMCAPLPFSPFYIISWIFPWYIYCNFFF